jgi:hypothetical protein
MLEKMLLFWVDLSLEIFVLVVPSFLLAVEAELLAGGAAVLAEALPTYLALVDGLRLHAADEALRHTFTSLFRTHVHIKDYLLAHKH